jgi:GT2 family glycosyltransferase
MTSPTVSIVVVSYEARDRLLACLAAVASRVTLPHELIVVDNASRDGSADAVRARFPAATLIANADNVGFSRANNQGLRIARAEYVLVLNGDAEVGAGAVEAMAAILDARADVGIVGPRTRYPDGRIQVSSGPMLGPVSEWRQRRLVRGVKRGEPRALARAKAQAAVEHEPAWVSGSCLLARRRAVEAVGLFDEAFFLYEEDVDLCVRVRRAGWRILFTPRAEVVHHLGASMAEAAERSALEYHRSHLRFYARHLGPVPNALLRASLAARGAVSWLASREASDRRRAASLVRLAAGRG